jgi:hypothetical protein
MRDVSRIWRRLFDIVNLNVPQTVGGNRLPSRRLRSYGLDPAAAPVFFLLFPVIDKNGSVGWHAFSTCAIALLRGSARRRLLFFFCYLQER